MPKHNRNKVEFEASWHHSPVAGGVVGFLLCIAVAQVCRMAGVSPLYLVAFGAAGAGVVVLQRRYRKVTGPGAVYRVICWMASALWIAWVVWRGYSVPAIAVLIIGTVLICVGAVIVATEPDTEAQERLQLEQQLLADLRDPFEREVDEVVNRLIPQRNEQKLALRRVYQWPGATGDTWEVEGPRGSTFNWEQLRNVQVELAAGLRLPIGCPANAAPATTHQGAALLHISRVNDMDKEILYPADYTRIRSITEEFDIGVYLDKTQVMLEIYQTSGLIAGQRGSGKTVLLQDMTAAVLQCGDALIWHVDLNGGGMSSAWMVPFATGEIPESVLDRIAPTPSTALLLAAHGEAIALDRKRRYQRMMITHNTDVLPVGNGRDVCSLCKMIHPPAIMIFVDEGGEVTGDEVKKDAQAAGEALRKLQRVGRAMAVNVVFSVQRGTSDYVSAQMKKAVGLAICLRVKDDSELAYVFDWKRGLSAGDLQHNGQAYIQRNSGPVRMFKTYRLLPLQITQIAKATLARRPQLDQAAVMLGGAEYRQRWGHPDIVDFLDGLRGDSDGQPMDMPRPVAVDTPRPELPARPTTGGESGFKNSRAAVDLIGDVVAAGRRAAEESAASPPTPTPDRREQVVQAVRQMSAPEILERLRDLHFDPDPEEAAPAAGDPAEAAQAGQPRPATPAARAAFVFELVATEGPIKTDDVVTKTIAAGLANHRQRVSETLKALRDAGRIEQGGDYAMWQVKSEG